MYDPRIVGNDMGLWVMGRTWLKFVDEADEELQEYTCPKGNICPLLKGLAALARGEAGPAQDAFDQAIEVAPKDELALLGRGTAGIVAGDDDSARLYYNRALEVAPGNKTAKRNLKVLEK